METLRTEREAHSLAIIGRAEKRIQVSCPCLDLGPQQTAPAHVGALCWALCSMTEQPVPMFWVDCCTLPQGRALWSRADLAAAWEVGAGAEEPQSSLVTNPTTAKDLFRVDQILPPLLKPPSSFSHPEPGLPELCPTQVTCRNFALSTHTASCLTVFLK